MLRVRKVSRVSRTSSGLSSTKRISIAPSIIIASKRKVKCRALVDLCFRPDTSPVTVNDALHNRQTDAGSLEVLNAMQPLKDAEELVDIPHVKTRAVVF